MNFKKDFIKKIEKKLIVSCQAVGDEPLNNTNAITLMAKSVLKGGAEILRLSQFKHIKAIREITDVPIIGLIKQKYINSEVVITPTLKEIKQLAKLNIECIAIDATNRKRPNKSLKEIIDYTKKEFPKLVLLADCATIDDVLNANEIGFDLVASTLRGYTLETKNESNLNDDYYFIKEMLKFSKVPVLAEGGIWSPEQVIDLLNLKVHAVIVGSAITRPQSITERFIGKINQNKGLKND